MQESRSKNRKWTAPNYKSLVEIKLADWGLRSEMMTMSWTWFLSQTYKGIFNQVKTYMQAVLYN